MGKIKRILKNSMGSTPLTNTSRWYFTFPTSLINSVIYLKGNLARRKEIKVGGRN